MNEVAGPSAGQRRAALTLHALAVPDREWLLAHLPAAGRAAVRELLAELRSLGIPADASVIRSALAEAAATPAMPNAKACAQLLARETGAFQGALLSLLAPAQREAVLAHWPRTLEARPTPAAPPSWTPRLQDALRESWHELAAAPEVQP